MLKKLQFTLLFLCLLRGSSLWGQDPIFSQFFNAPLQLNPAFAGNAYAPFVALNYRAQYPAFNNGPAYSTFAASYDQYLSGLNSGVGFSLMTDDAGQGIWRKTYVSAHYSYKVNFSEDFVAKLGVETGFIQSNLNWDKLVFGDQLDPITGATNPDGSPRPTNETRPDQLNRTLFDISSGILFYGKGFYGGASAKHLATPNEGFLNVNQNLRIGLPIRWNVHAGYEVILKKATRIKPAVFVTPSVMFVKQSDFAQFMGGAYGGFGPIFAGFWYRHAYTNPESIVALIGFRQEYYKIGYSFDYTIGSLAGRTGGSHEVSLTINFDPNPRKFDINDCFKMFR